MAESFTQASPERLELLKKEKELQKLKDSIAEMRRKLPRKEVTKSYSFHSRNGAMTLGDLFKGKSQLVIYHFMFGEDWSEPCKSCSFWTDGLSRAASHVQARDANLVICAYAPMKKLAAAAARMGWDEALMVSSHGSDFNKDFGVHFPKDMEDPVYNYRPRQFDMEHLPGLSVFLKDEGDKIFHTYSTYARGLEGLNTTYSILDLLPKGRNEDPNIPYKMYWVKYRVDYEHHPPPAPGVVTEITSPDTKAHMEWLKKGLNAKVEFMAEDPESKLVSHAELVINNGYVYMVEAPPSQEGANGAATAGRMKVCVHLNCVDADEVFAQAIKEGAKAMLDIHDSNFGARYGRFRDPFGQEWSVYHPLPEKKKEGEPEAKKQKSSA